MKGTLHSLWHRYNQSERKVDSQTFSQYIVDATSRLAREIGTGHESVGRAAEFTRVIVDSGMGQTELRNRVPFSFSANLRYRWLTDVESQTELGAVVIKTYDTNIKPHLGPSHEMTQEGREMMKDHPDDRATHTLSEEMIRRYRSLNKSRGIILRSLQIIYRRISMAP